jgi:hypothetical protein
MNDSFPLYDPKNVSRPDCLSRPDLFEPTNDEWQIASFRPALCHPMEDATVNRRSRNLEKNLNFFQKCQIDAVKRLRTLEGVRGTPNPLQPCFQR